MCSLSWEPRDSESSSALRGSFRAAWKGAGAEAVRLGKPPN